MLQNILPKTAYFEKLSLFLKIITYSCSPTSYDSESPKIMFIGGELVKLWGSQLGHSNFDFSPKKAAPPRLLQTAVNVTILPPEHVQDRSGTGYELVWTVTSSDRSCNCKKPCKTAVNRSTTVSVSVSRYFEPGRTGLGLGLPKFGRKTGPDRTSKH